MKIRFDRLQVERQHQPPRRIDRFTRALVFRRKATVHLADDAAAQVKRLPVLLELLVQRVRARRHRLRLQRLERKGLGHLAAQNPGQVVLEREHVDELHAVVPEERHDVAPNARAVHIQRAIAASTQSHGAGFDLGSVEPEFLTSAQHRCVALVEAAERGVLIVFAGRDVGAVHAGRLHLGADRDSHRLRRVHHTWNQKQQKGRDRAQHFPKA